MAQALTMEMIEAVESTFGPENPFYAPSALPFGVPPFDRIRDEHYEPAMRAGMDEQAREIAAIIANPDASTFANTVEALERSGQLLDRVWAAFGAIAGACTNQAAEQLQQTMAPLMSAHADGISLNAGLFARIAILYEARSALGLEPEALRLLELNYQQFVHAGARLNDAEKQQLMALNAEESTLRNGFSRKLLAANRAAAFYTSDVAALAGLAEDQLAAAAAAANARGEQGYALALQNTTQQPVLAQLTVRSTRQAIFERSLARAEQGDDNDLRATVSRLAELRAEKARLLGFETYAAWKLENQMAKTPAAAVAFLDALVPSAVQLVGREQAELEQQMRAEGADFLLAAWDWEFYAERVRKAKYDLDEAELRPYFELNKVLEDGVFHAATQLFGLTFARRNDLPVYAPDVQVYEIFNADGTHLAIFYADWFARENKRGGAWMSSFIGQSRLLATQPVIYNVCNFAQPAEGMPALITFSDVTTMFHEFGHALHGMFSSVVYPSLAGTSVPRDFVEFPSQFNEHWATEPEVFARYARHHQTGEPMPADLAAKMKAARQFNQGYGLAEVLAAAELDLEWHTLTAGSAVGDAEAFAQAALERKDIALQAVPPRYRSSYFAHIWGGGYAAGYYAYLWAELLDAAGFQWFTQHGGMTRDNGDRLREMILSGGNTEDLKAMYERWLGGEPEIGPMLRQRGLN